jgi:hypothetical protein
VAAGDPATVSVTAFAEQIKSWPTEDAYRAEEEPGKPQFAARSLIPSGLFTLGNEASPRAEAIITGVVRRGERKTNHHTGADFDWCELETYAASVDMVASRQAAPFVIGQVVQGTFWLVAHRSATASGTKRHRRRWFRR